MFAPIDRIVRISLRVDTIEVPPQDVVTKDNVTVKVNAVIFFRVIDPRLAVSAIRDIVGQSPSDYRKQAEMMARVPTCFAMAWTRPSSFGEAAAMDAQ